MFGIDKYRIALEYVAVEKEIDIWLRSNLIEVDGPNKIAKFEQLDENSKGTGQFWKIKVRFN